ncbi:MAG: polysaccharide biosynthesis/export family protein, partial [Verrucomicrobium sp.]
MRASIIFARLVALAALLVASTAFSQQAMESPLRSGDSIVVKISGVPGEEVAVVSNTYDIGDSGTINLPYIGQLKASGVRPSTLQKEIETAYKTAQIFTHPTIQVTANREAATQVIYVSGEIRSPGRITITPGMTIHDAIT